MAKILLILSILAIALIGAAIIYEKVIHPILFKEEIEETLESAVEEKIRNEVKKQAEEISGGDDAIT